MTTDFVPTGFLTFSDSTTLDVHVDPYLGVITSRTNGKNVGWLIRHDGVVVASRGLKLVPVQGVTYTPR